MVITSKEPLQILRSGKDGGRAGRQLKLTGVVHVLVVQARGVLAMDGGTSSDPYCKVTLGKEKTRTKGAARYTIMPNSIIVFPHFFN